MKSSMLLCATLTLFVSSSQYAEEPLSAAQLFEQAQHDHSEGEHYAQSRHDAGKRIRADRKKCCYSTRVHRSCDNIAMHVLIPLIGTAVATGFWAFS